MVGLATAWALEKSGHTCLVFEHGAPGGGQSVGESRIFRHSHDDPRQFDLALQARQDWRDWEEEFGVELISPDGAMVIGDPAVARMEKYADAPGAMFRELEPADVRKALPPLAEFEGRVLIDEAAGAIKTRLTLAILIGSIGLNLVPERVDSVNPRDGGGVDVVTSVGRRTFDAVVVAAGMGTVGLAATAGVELPVLLRAHVRITLPLRSPSPARRLACLQDSSGEFGETRGYGSPVRGNREYAVGLALNVEIDPTSAEDPLSALADRTRKYVERALPGLDSDGSQEMQAWVTELPWGADGLAVWQRGDAFFIAGHNLFKLAPALGKMLARSVDAGTVEPGFLPSDRLGEEASGTPRSASAL
ncbi:MAG: FAD-binding oxidoreductase [Actinomycetota bacterium]|nr:FAD-binding oxidoreductase [Actinomycetota bacterium]